MLLKSDSKLNASDKRIGVEGTPQSGVWWSETVFWATLFCTKIGSISLSGSSWMYLPQTSLFFSLLSCCTLHALSHGDSPLHSARKHLRASSGGAEWLLGWWWLALIRRQAFCLMWLICLGSSWTLHRMREWSVLRSVLWKVWAPIVLWLWGHLNFDLGCVHAVQRLCW